MTKIVILTIFYLLLWVFLLSTSVVAEQITKTIVDDCFGQTIYNYNVAGQSYNIKYNGGGTDNGGYGSYNSKNIFLR